MVLRYSINILLEQLFVTRFVNNAENTGKIQIKLNTYKYHNFVV